MASHKDIGKKVECVANGCHQEFELSKTHYEQYGKWCVNCSRGLSPKPYLRKSVSLIEIDGKVQRHTAYIPIDQPLDMHIEL